MRVRINDNELYDVRFRTKKREKNVKKALRDKIFDASCTISLVDESKKGAEKYEKVSEALLCLNSAVDVEIYNKWSGRKGVFSRALVSFNKEDRVKFWIEYRNVVGDKRFRAPSIRGVVKKEVSSAKGLDGEIEKEG